MSEKRPLIIAFDFDGTLVTNKYPLIGELITANVKFLRELKKRGCIIIIWTCRDGDGFNEMLAYLRANNIPFDNANRNPYFETGSRKIYADYYFDDRNIPLPSQDEEKAVEFLSTAGLS